MDVNREPNLSKVAWAGAAAIVIALAVAASINPVAALIPFAMLGLLLMLMASASHVRGLALGLSITLLVVLSSNSAPTELRIAGVGATTLIAVIAIARQPRSKSRMPAGAAVICAFIGYLALVSLFTSSSSLLTVIATLAAPLILALVSAKATATDFLVFTRILVGLAVSQVVVAILELTVLTDPIWGYRNTTLDGTGVVIRYNPFLGDSIARAQGTLGHPIMLAMLMLVTVLICASSVTRSHTMLRVIGVSAGLAGLLLSGTRSAILSLVVAIAYLLLSASGFLMKSRNVLLIIVAAGTIYVGDFGTRDVVNDLMTSDSLGHRIDGWALALGLFDRGPLAVVFGSGMNSESTAFANGYLQQDGFAVIDNQLITTFLISGLIGTVLLFASIVMAFISTVRYGRGLIIGVTVMFFSFDVTTWVISFALLAIAVSVPASCWSDTSIPVKRAPSTAGERDLANKERALRSGEFR